MQSPTEFVRRQVTSSESGSNLRSLIHEKTSMSDLEDVDEESVPKRISRNRRVMVLLTGGTMAMRATGKGGSLEPAAGYLAEQMRAMSELRDAKMSRIQYNVIEYEPLLDSADMCPGDWSTIAKDVASHHEDYDGFVVILGTDTMAYCASALSFMLEGLKKPVVLTGSMVPFCEAHSDARRNLILSLIFAAGLVGHGKYHQTPPEVLIFFHDRLLRGCRASKMDALGLAAFDSPNFVPLATVGVSIRDNFERAALDSQYRSLSTGCSAMLKMETRIVVVRVIPGFHDAALAACFASPSLKAVVLELYGTGTAPSRRRKLIGALQVAAQNNVLVVATTQCRHGGVIMDTYAVGQALLEVGVISGHDMTIEAAATKLAYLFGKYPDDPDTVRRLFSTNIRGELSPPELYTRPFFEDSFFIPPLPSALPLSTEDRPPIPNGNNTTFSDDDFTTNSHPPTVDADDGTHG